MGLAVVTDIPNALLRAARRNGWKEEPRNSLDYFTHRFCRPEPEGRVSRILVRVTHRIVDAQIDIGGLRQSFTLPTLQRIEQAMASQPPAPVHYNIPMPEGYAEVLDGAVSSWRAKHPSDLSDAVRGGNDLADAAEDLLRNMKGDK
jgi:hypothetical protein